MTAAEYLIIYFIAVLTVSYILSAVYRKTFKLNMSREAQKKPVDFTVAGLCIFALNIICGCAACIAAADPKKNTVAVVLCCAVAAFETAGLIFAFAKFRRAHWLLIVIPAVPAYCAPAIYGRFADLGFMWYVSTALLSSVLFAVSNSLFNEMRDKAGVRPAPTARLNKNPSLRSQVMCGGTHGLSKYKYIYSGIGDCHAQSILFGGSKYCSDGCIGCGSCVSTCKFSAIVVIDGIAAVSKSKCVGCGACVKSCPRGLIKLIPRSAEYWVGCSSVCGEKSREYCKMSCIGCGKCADVCPSDAIVMTEYGAEINYQKCINCGRCARACPTHCIWTLHHN